MKKSWLTLLLAGVLCFNVTACQSVSDSEVVEVDSKNEENEAYLGENSDTSDYSEFRIKNAKFMVPNRVTSTEYGVEDAMRFSDSETYEVKARFCEISLLDDDTTKVAENIEDYYDEYFDVTVKIDEKNCIEAHDGEKSKYIYSSATYNDNNASFAYISNENYHVLFHIINRSHTFTDEEVIVMLKSLEEYTGSDYSAGIDAELVELTPVEDILSELDEEETAALPDEKFNNPLCSFELTVKDETISLPIWYSDLEAAGWTFNDDSSKEMAANTSESWHEWEKDGIKLSATMTNFSVNSASYSECIVTTLGYSLHPRNSEEDIVTLPENIQMHKSTYDDIVNAYGEPDRTSDGNEALYMAYYEFDFEHEVRFTFDIETDVVYAVEINCEETLEGINNDVSNERPEILDTYEAPSKLSENPYDITFELDGVMYQLPCPTEVFLKNGWNLEEGNDFPVSPGVGELFTLAKNDMRIGVRLQCPVPDAVIAENTYVTSVDISAYDGTKMPFSLYGGITIGEEMTAEKLSAAFENMEVDADTSRKDIQHFFMSATAESGSKVKYYIVIKDGVVGSIEIDNIMFFDR